MGSSVSKPDASSTPHIWKGSSPSVSSDIVESLQSSSETDTSRNQTHELQIQKRVADELRKLQAKEAEALKVAQEKISEIAPGKEGPGGQDRNTVAKELEALKARLEERRQVRALPESVEAARSEVVRCLRENDRRPLDCWQEVEKFKEEVRKLEKGWVNKVVG
ncbi:DUF1690-domain-containing protein [Thozetella sp. PMI_491]|nr:DUF1690-domain-containing protein [Thozetella sp. PMI_491]